MSATRTRNRVLAPQAQAPAGTRQLLSCCHKTHFSDAFFRPPAFISAVPVTRLVIIDDHTLVRDLLRDVIDALKDIEVVAVAGTVLEGIAKCQELKPDMAIVDWMLPDGTGLEIVRNLRKNLPDTRILMLTANEQEGIVKDAAELGVQGFVSKRQTIPVLREAIQALAGGKHYYCPSSYNILMAALKQDRPGDHPKLNDREWAILRALANGMSTKDIASELALSHKTVCNHVTSLKMKLNVKEPAGLVLFALKHGLVELK